MSVSPAVRAGGHAGLPALLERPAAALVERARDLGELDAALELRVAGQTRRQHLRLLDDDAAAGPDDAAELGQRLVRVEDVVEHVAAPDPVEAAVLHRQRRRVALEELEAAGVEALAHQFARRLHALGGRLDPQHAAPETDILGEPQRVEPDSAARVEPDEPGGSSRSAMRTRASGSWK
jgi:hypothetical protein